jgi:subtilisin family serine protease
MGYDFIGRDEDPTDVANGLDDDGDGLVDEGFGHGTFVASLVLAVAPQARVLAIRALDSDARSTSSMVASAISYAVSHGAKAINLSLGIQADMTAVRQAIQSAMGAGVPVFAAAGNRQGAVDFPALLSEVTAVTAVDDTDRRAPFASFGSSVDLSAPGVNVLGAFPRPGAATARWSGTSFSTAITTGAFALLRQMRPSSSASDLVKRLTDTSKSVDSLNPSFAGQLGRGRLDLAAATVVD